MPSITKLSVLVLVLGIAFAGRAQRQELKLSQTFKDSCMWTEAVGEYDKVYFYILDRRTSLFFRLDTFGIFGDTTIGQFDYLKVYQVERLDYFNPGKKKLFSLLRYSADQDSCFIRYDAHLGVDTGEHLIFAFNTQPSDSFYVFFPFLDSNKIKARTWDTIHLPRKWKADPNYFAVEYYFSTNVRIDPDLGFFLFPFTSAVGSGMGIHYSLMKQDSIRAINLKKDSIRLLRCVLHVRPDGSFEEVYENHNCYLDKNTFGLEEEAVPGDVQFSSEQQNLRIQCQSACRISAYDHLGRELIAPLRIDQAPFEYVLEPPNNNQLTLIQVWCNGHLYHKKLIR